MLAEPNLTSNASASVILFCNSILAASRSLFIFLAFSSAFLIFSVLARISFAESVETNELFWTVLS
ncbi:hypothetical protein MALH05_00661 [Mycoplasma anatis]|nr:hypothetical protein [Mycoplasmopsis anatis]